MEEVELPRHAMPAGPRHHFTRGWLRQRRARRERARAGDERETDEEDGRESMSGHGRQDSAARPKDGIRAPPFDPL
jgi:hypothetical protein